MQLTAQSRRLAWEPPEVPSSLDFLTILWSSLGCEEFVWPDHGLLGGGIKDSAYGWEEALLKQASLKQIFLLKKDWAMLWAAESMHLCFIWLWAVSPHSSQMLSRQISDSPAIPTGSLDILLPFPVHTAPVIDARPSHCSLSSLCHIPDVLPPAFFGWRSAIFNKFVIFFRGWWN